MASLTLLPTFVPEGKRGRPALGALPAAWCSFGGLLPVHRRGLVPRGGHGNPLWLGAGLSAPGAAVPSLPEGLAHRKASLYVGIELLLLFALLGAACLVSGGTWFVSAVV